MYVLRYSNITVLPSRWVLGSLKCVYFPVAVFDFDTFLAAP